MSEREGRYRGDSSGAEVPGVGLPGVELPGAGFPGVGLPEARLPGASPHAYQGDLGGEWGLDCRFEELRLAAPPAPFAPPAAVRRRGRQRSHRQAGVASVAAVAAVLVMAVVGVGVLHDATGHRPVEEENLIGEPAPDSPMVPREWLLSANELGPDWQPTTQELFETGPAWFWSDFCPQPPDGGYRSLESRVDFAVVSWRNDTTAPPSRIDHVVELFESAPAAAANLNEVRDVVATCPPPPTPEGEVAPSGLEIVDGGFAGEESLLIEHVSYFFDGEDLAAQPHTRPIVVIRAGATIGTLIYGGEQDVREVAKIAADLLDE